MSSILRALVRQSKLMHFKDTTKGIGKGSGTTRKQVKPGKGKFSIDMRSRTIHLRSDPRKSIASYGAKDTIRQVSKNVILIVSTHKTGVRKLPTTRVVRLYGRDVVQINALRELFKPSDKLRRSKNYAAPPQGWSRFLFALPTN